MSANPPLFPPELGDLLQLASAWCEQQELAILGSGVPLSAQETQWAIEIGVVHPGRVRLLCVDDIPQPQDPVLHAAAQRYGFLSPGTMGMSLRYGIFIRREVWRENMIIVHELVHTGQYERLGGIAPFLSQYLGECLSVGYNQSPLEREAVSTARQILGRGTTSI